MASSDELTLNQYRKMTETPIPKLILGLAAPTILSMLITSIYNLADTFFVGQISTSASGAVGVVSSLMAIIQALGFMLGHGSGTIIKIVEIVISYFFIESSSFLIRWNGF